MLPKLPKLPPGRAAEMGIRGRRLQQRGREIKNAVPPAARLSFPLAWGELCSLHPSQNQRSSSSAREEADGDGAGSDLQAGKGPGEVFFYYYFIFPGDKRFPQAALRRCRRWCGPASASPPCPVINIPGGKERAARGWGVLFYPDRNLTLTQPLGEKKE